MAHHGRVIGCYGNCAAVNHLTGGGLTVFLEPFAGFPLVAFRTGAVEVLAHAVARGRVLTGVWMTSICRGPCWDLTQLSSKLRRAFTHEAVEYCVAFAVVVARLAITLVPLDFTVNAHEARGTLAVITPWPFLACCSILALTVAAI